MGKQLWFIVLYDYVSRDISQASNCKEKKLVYIVFACPSNSHVSSISQSCSLGGQASDCS